MIFEVQDKTGRKIYLTKERWSHIRKKHPEVEEIEAIKKAIAQPDKIINYPLNESINYFYKYFKNHGSKTRGMLTCHTSCGS